MRIIYLRKQLNVILACLLLLLSLLGTPGMGIGVPLESLTAWKFAVISNTQGDNSETNNKSCINDAVVRAMAEDIVRENPDLVLVSGDLINGWFRNGGTDYAAQYANWKEAMRSVYHAGIRVYPIRGNHDSGTNRFLASSLPRCSMKIGQNGLCSQN